MLTAYEVVHKEEVLLKKANKSLEICFDAKDCFDFIFNQLKETHDLSEEAIKRNAADRGITENELLRIYKIMDDNVRNECEKFAIESVETKREYSDFSLNLFLNDDFVKMAKSVGVQTTYEVIECDKLFSRRSKNNHVSHSQSAIQPFPINLSNSDSLANMFYNDFISVYKQIQEIMNFDQVVASRELLVFVVNYYKSLIFSCKNYYKIDVKTISDSFIEKVKVSSGYNLISEEFINSNYNDFVYLIDNPCDWLGQTCCNYTTKEYLEHCRKNENIRRILFLVECIFLLKFSGRIFKLDELKSVVMVERGDATPIFKMFSKTINIVIGSYRSLNKQLDYAKNVATNGNSSIPNTCATTNSSTSNPVTCGVTNKEVSKHTWKCDKCGNMISSLPCSFCETQSVTTKLPELKIKKWYKILMKSIIVFLCLVLYLLLNMLVMLLFNVMFGYGISGICLPFIIKKLCNKWEADYIAERGRFTEPV